MVTLYFMCCSHIHITDSFNILTVPIYEVR